MVNLPIVNKNYAKEIIISAFKTAKQNGIYYIGNDFEKKYIRHLGTGFINRNFDDFYSYFKHRVTDNRLVVGFILQFFTASEETFFDHSSEHILGFLLQNKLIDARENNLYEKYYKLLYKVKTIDTFDQDSCEYRIVEIGKKALDSLLQEKRIYEVEEAVQKCDPSNKSLPFLGNGRFSIVSSLGDNHVLKLGTERINWECPYYPRLVPSQYRKKYDTDENGIPPLYVEIQKKYQICRDKSAINRLYIELKNNRIVVPFQEADLQYDNYVYVPLDDIVTAVPKGMGYCNEGEIFKISRDLARDRVCLCDSDGLFYEDDPRLIKK